MRSRRTSATSMEFTFVSPPGTQRTQRKIHKACSLVSSVVGKPRYSSLPRKSRDDPDVADAGRLQPIEHFHQVLQLHAAIAAQVHLLVDGVLHLLTHAFLQEVRPDRFVAQ